MLGGVEKWWVELRNCGKNVAKIGEKNKWFERW